MRFRTKTLIATLVLILQIIGPANAVTPKAGSGCSKLGITATYAGKKYTCVKSGSKLVWNKGVAITSSTNSETSSSNTSIKISNSSEYISINDCKLNNTSSNNDNNQSHSPRTINVIDTSRTIRVLIFSVDFPDLISSKSDAPDFKVMTKNIADFYSSQSNKKINFEWTVSPKFHRMTNSIESYGVGARAAGNVWKLNEDIQDLAREFYSFDKFDVIVASAPTATTREQIASSPAFPAHDLKYKPATYLGGDYWSNRQSWTIPAHEFGHFALGLADLYDFKASMLQQAGFAQQFQHMGVYDIMNWAEGAGLEMSAWNRWIGKLITDNQIYCLPNSTTTTLLKPIEDTTSSVKGLVVPLSTSTVLVIENRAAMGYDASLTEGAQGIIVYEVDSSIDNGNGPMKLIRKDKSTDVWFRDNALKNGQSISYKGVTIKVVGTQGKNYFVEVSKKS